jgi:hypothetical protein
VRNLGELDGAAREDAVLVLGVRDHEAVGGHQDGTGELGEFLALVLPRRAEVADEVVVLLELGIGVARQHLAVRVDVDAGAGGLLEQCLEIGEVVAGDQDGLALALAERNLGRLGVAVRACVGRVEELHRAEVGLAGAERQTDPLIDAEFLVERRGERLEDVAVDGVVGVAERASVVLVSADALQAVQGDLLQRLDVDVALGIPWRTELLALGDLAGDRVCDCQIGERLGVLAGAASAANARLQAFAKGDGRIDLRRDGLRIEIDVGKGREQRVVCERALHRDVHATRLGVDGDHGKAAHGVDEEILHRGDLG